MGRLERLELENFKSYHGKQVVGPFDNFTCIIGPNGAGKSNMMDAISFVLGVQSRHLRSSHLKELVFRKDADSAPARKASVKLIYRLSQNEITGRAEGSELAFCRSISAAGVSSYRLDNKDVSYEKYEETLQSIGVLVKARNFLVFQGDVETVAAKSPQDLTKLLEQISGSDQFIEEYNELLRLKTEAEEKTIFGMQKKKMYSTQCREVKEQKDEAEYFQDKKHELAELYTDYVLFQIWTIKSEQEAKQDNADELREQLETIKQTEEELEGELEQHKTDFAKASKTLSASEKSYAGVHGQLDSVTPKLNETRAKMKSLQKRLAEQERAKSRVQKDIANQQDKVTGLQNDIAELETAEEHTRQQIEKAADSGLKLNPADMKEYTSLRERVSSQIAIQNAEKLTIELDLKSKNELLNRINSQMETSASEEVSCEGMITECEQRQALLSGAVKNCTTEQKQLLAAREQLVKDLASSEAQQRSLTAELDSVRAKLSEVGDERRRGKQEERMNEAISTMQRIFKGVHGRLADLCRPSNKKYSQAVSVAAGKHMDAVVVESTFAAQECIRYLKEQRVGTCTFLPLDNIVVKPVSERLRSFGQKYKLCVDLLECEDIYKPAVSYAVGSTLVCDTLQDAQDLCFTRNERVKVVTLKGHSINKSGAMTGGASVSSGNSDRWEEREGELLRKKKVELEAQLSTINTATTRATLLDQESRIRSLTSKIQLSNTDLTVVTEKLQYLQQQKSLRKENMTRLQNEVNSVSAEVRALEKKLAKVQADIQAVESTVFAAFSEKLGITNIREYESTTLKKHQSLLAQQQSIAKQTAELSAQLQYELKKDFLGTLERINTSFAEATAELVALTDAEQSLLHEEIAIRGNLKTLNEKLTTLRANKDAIHSTLKSLQARRGEVLKDRDVVSKKLNDVEIMIERYRTNLHEILQKARVDEVALPTINPNNEGTSGGARLQTIQDESDSSSSRAQSRHSNNTGSSSNANTNESNSRDDLYWEGTDSNSRRGGEGGTAGTTTNTSMATGSAHYSQADNPTVVRDAKAAARVDLSSVRRKYKNLTKQRVEEVERTFKASIAETLATLEKIQPNMHAAERYEGVVDKLRECNEHLEGTKDTARELAVRFEEVKKQRQTLFQECYDAIKESLGTIYRDLTCSAKHPLGGKAYLTLDNTDEPYLGGIRFTAMPPMKRFRDMDQLSGGEKTMAALALLFSVHSYRQAPFFVLDEVDAALDNVNVKKICNYIKQRSADFQCVVISLKEMFFEHADCLVGICKDVNTLSSEVLTLDLSKYADNTDSSNNNNTSRTVEGMEIQVGGGGAYSPAPSSIAHSNTGSGSRVPHSAGGGSAQGSADRVNNRTSVGSNNSNSGTSGFVGIAGEGLAQHLGKRKSPAEKGIPTTVTATATTATTATVGASRASRSSARTTLQQREVIYEETEDDVEDSSA